MVLAAMPMTTASPLLGLRHSNHGLRHSSPTLTNGSFTGVFAMKNETGYVPLGTFSGTYTGEMFGSFIGTWALYNGSASGTFSGYCLSHLFFGWLNTTGSNQSNMFIGLYRVNTTDNSFEAGAIVFANDQYYIRYMMGTI